MRESIRRNNIIILTTIIVSFILIDTGFGNTNSKQLKSPKHKIKDFRTCNFNFASYESHNFIANKNLQKLASVELEKFVVFPQGQQVKLTWITNAEIKNEKFEVQRTVDGNTFFTIGEVNGNGTTNVKNHYTFVDKQPINGTVFYRLKQVDYNKKIDYSTYESVNMTLSNASIAASTSTLDANIINLTVNNIGKGECEISIYDKSGNLQFASKQSIYQSFSELKLTGTQDLSDGIYIVTLELGLNEYHRKIVVKGK